MSLTDSQANAEIMHGTIPATVLLAGTVTKGDAVGFSSGWKRALATTGGVIQLTLVAGEDGVAGQWITAYLGPVRMGGRFSGGTAGAALYVAEATLSGKYTETAPSTSGDANTVVGYVVNATEVLVTPRFNVDSTA